MKHFILLLITLLAVKPTFAQISWQKVYNDAAGSYSLASTTNGNVYAYRANNMAISTTGGASGTWTPTPSPALAAADLYAHKNTLFLIDRSGTGSKGVLRSLDFGATWQPANSGLIGNDSANIVGFQSIDNLIFLYHDGSAVNKIYLSTDNGSNWNSVLNLTSSHSGVNVVKKGSSLYLITTGTVYKCDDGGYTWNNLGVTFPTYGSTTHTLSDGTFIMRSGEDLYTSTDGTTWSSVVTTGLPSSTLTRQFIKSPSSDTLYLSTEITVTSIYGLYCSADKGLTWMTCDNGLITNAQIANNGYPTLHIATNGYLFSAPEHNGVYRTANPVSTTSVSTIGVEDVRANITTVRLYPNPVVSDIQFEFTAKQSGTATIKLNDITGKAVMLKDMNIVVGNNRAKLDVSTLAAGTYSVNITTGADIKTATFTKQ